MTTARPGSWCRRANGTLMARTARTMALERSRPRLGTHVLTWAFALWSG